jgi:hypothetical protein
VELLRLLLGTRENSFAPAHTKPVHKRKFGPLSQAADTDKQLTNQLYNFGVALIVAATGSDVIPPQGERSEWKYHWLHSTSCRN